MKNDPRLILMMTCVSLILLASCSRKKMDNDIKADIATKASSEIALTGVDYTVSNGVVNLTGFCPTIKEKIKAEETIKGIAGIRQVINNIQLGPVLLNGDHTLKAAADSAIKNYSLAQASVQDSVITVKGQVSQKDLQKILTALDSLHPRSVQNQLTAE